VCPTYAQSDISIGETDLTDAASALSSGDYGAVYYDLLGSEVMVIASVEDILIGGRHLSDSLTADRSAPRNAKTVSNNVFKASGLAYYLPGSTGCGAAGHMPSG
jgi:hypothetical protein